MFLAEFVTFIVYANRVYKLKFPYIVNAILLSFHMFYLRKDKLIGYSYNGAFMVQTALWGKYVNIPVK